jgi:hypothetical protein
MQYEETEGERKTRRRRKDKKKEIGEYLEKMNGEIRRNIVRRDESGMEK